MNQADAIRDAFVQLREICDPRGHGLLASLEEICLLNQDLLAILDDNDDHSRHAERTVCASCGLVFRDCVCQAGPDFGDGPVLAKERHA